MTIEIKKPCSLIDLARFCHGVTPLYWLTCREMHSGGPTWSIHHEGACIMIGGLYPLAEGRAEAWFMTAPDAAPHMRFIIRACRLTLARLSYREIIAFCRSRAGRRIASAIGFSHWQDTDIGEIRVWRASWAEATTPQPGSLPRHSGRTSQPLPPRRAKPTRRPSAPAPRRSAAADPSF